MVYRKISLPLVLLSLLHFNHGAVASSPDERVLSGKGYRLQPIKTHMVAKPIERYRIQQHTRYVPRQITRFRTVQKQKTETRSVKVAVPVTETIYRQESYTVWRPAYENQDEDQKVNREGRKPEQGSTSRLIAEERFREIPVKTTKLVYREQKRSVLVDYYELEAFQDTVYSPICRPMIVRDFETTLVPKITLQRNRVQYTDPFSPAILAGYSSFIPPILQPEEKSRN